MVGGIIVGCVILGAVALAIYFHYHTKQRRIAAGLPAKFEPVTAIQKLPPEQLQGVMNSTSMIITARGFTPVSQGSGMYTYQKQQQANPIIAILLLFLCFIPGIVYLVIGGGTKTISVSLFDSGNFYSVSVNGPPNLKKIIWSNLAPYRFFPPDSTRLG